MRSSNGCCLRMNECRIAGVVGVLLTYFETRKHDLVRLGISADGIARMYLPEIDTSKSWTARLKITPEMGVKGRIGLLRGLLRRLRLLLSFGVKVLVSFTRIVSLHDIRRTHGGKWFAKGKLTRMVVAM
jgi:hypothetical protein